MESQRINTLSQERARLVLVSAWNDSGGGFLTRLLDGHQSLRGWPFELQLGVSGANSAHAGIIHDKYRWPKLNLAQDRTGLFDALMDEELKSVLAGRALSRFAGYEPSVTLEAWRAAFCDSAIPQEPSRRDIIAAYIDSYFRLAGDKPAASWVLGHCPCVVLDADSILADFPTAKIIHIIRDPVTGLGDFRRRQRIFDAERFAERWKLVNGEALNMKNAHRDAVMLLRYEDLLAVREASLRQILDFLDLPFNPATLIPSWRGRPLSDQDLGPFGGVGKISREYENAIRASISEPEQERLRTDTAELMEALNHVLPPVTS